MTHDDASRSRPATRASAEPRAASTRAASTSASRPGVVTVIARRRRGDARSGGSGPGLGLRHLRRRRDRHQRPRRDDRRRAAHPQGRAGLRAVRRRQPGRRRRSSASTPTPTSRCCKIDPTGLTLRPLPLGSASDLGSARRSRRSAPRSARSSRCRSASSRRPPLDRLADRLQDRGRDPDRRGDQPRQLGRPAARRARPRAGHQLADRDRHRRGQRASASRCRSTSCAARWRSCAAAARVHYAYLGV